MSQPYDVFVSYSREDKSRVLPWVEELKKGSVSVFFDTESLLGGSKWQNDIAEAIRTAKLVMLFVSRASVASEFVPKELALSVDMKKDILPVLLEETEIRGQVAFCIAGLHRIEAYDPDLRKVWGNIQASLGRVGISWKPPSRFLIDDVRQRSRDVALDGGPGNVRVNRERDPKPAPAPTPTPTPAPRPEPEESEEIAQTGGWLRAWFVLMAAALGIILFFWLDGPSWLKSKTGFVHKVEPVTPKPEPKPIPKPELVETLEEEAQRTATEYYQAANQNPASQLDYLAEPVDYLAHPGWTKADVRADLESYAKKWTHQQITMLKMPVARVVEVGKIVECDVPLRCTSENAVVKNITSFTGRLRLQLIGSALKIVSVSELPGTRKSEPLKFDRVAQEKKAIEHVARAMTSGSSNSNMTPEAVAAMYEEESDYLGRTKKPRAEIATEVGNVIARLKSQQKYQQFHVLEAPEIVQGLGTDLVEVKAAVGFLVSSLAGGVQIEKGWVRSVYFVHFTANGTPLIQKEAVVERGK